MNLRTPDFEDVKHENEQESTALITFSDFDSIKQVSSQGIEYWSARDIRDLLRYTAWRSFESTLKQAMRTCRLTKQDVNHHYTVFAQEIGTLVSHEVAMSKEQETIGQIIRAFQHYETIKQYKVEKYCIDLYFPMYRVAVECDEHGHMNYSLQKELQRQVHIENVLGCTFVRYNPDAKKFNIVEVIHKIIMLIYHQ